MPGNAPTGTKWYSQEDSPLIPAILKIWWLHSAVGSWLDSAWCAGVAFTRSCQSETGKQSKDDGGGDDAECSGEAIILLDGDAVSQYKQYGFNNLI